MGEETIDLQGRTPVPTRFHWDAVQMTSPDGTQENLVVLVVETAVGRNVFFMNKEVALQVATGIGTYARALPDTEAAATLIVPDVDMTAVVKHLNGKRKQ